MTPDGPAAVIVLAAGEGTRMRTSMPKMLNEVCGRAMLGHVVAAARVRLWHDRERCPIVSQSPPRPT